MSLLVNLNSKEIKSFFINTLIWINEAQYKRGKQIGFLPKATIPYIRLFPYPEITGYALSLYSKLYSLLKEPLYINGAEKAKNALLTLQLDNGGFRFSLKRNTVIMFDHIVMVNGLIDYWHLIKPEKDDKLKKVIIKGLEYILSSQRKDGSMPISTPNFHSLYSHFYLAKALIPLLKAYRIFNDENFLIAAKRLATYVLKRYLRNGFLTLESAENKIIMQWNRYHYLLYALEGFIALGEGEKRYFGYTKQILDAILSRLDDSGIKYSYNLRGENTSKYVDLAATAQALRLSTYMYSKTFEDKYLYSINKLLNILIKKQHKSPLSLHKGGVPFGYKHLDFILSCSWATEFALDSCLMLIMLSRKESDIKIIF